MEFKKIELNNGTLMPQLGLGTWQLNSSECIHSVKRALELGYTHIDTAEMYMNEEEIGVAIKNSAREKLFITSKVWQKGLTYERVLKACEISLTKLGTEYLDLYLIHWPDKYMDLRDVLKAFKKLYDGKKIRAFGVSNFTINHLKDTLKVANELNLPISVNQVEFHPYLYQKELLNFCKEHNIILTAYSPLIKGKIVSDETINKIANKHEKTPGQVTLQWMIQKSIVVIPKASSENHLKENINLNFSLDEEDIMKIDNINKKERLINPGFGEFDY